MPSTDIQKDIAAVGRIASVPSLLKLISDLTGMRLTLVARVTETSWTACAVEDQMHFGLKVGDQLDLATTLCREVRDANQAVVIESVSQDAVYCNHPTPKLYQFESYISVPLVRPNGEFFGTLCGLDNKSSILGAKLVETISMFADLIARQIEFEDDLQQAEKSLLEERAMSQLREEFIAVLGHDLRTPLGGISAIAQVIDDLGTEPVPPQLVKGLHDSAGQMSRLIDDVLDLARGRLGGGIPVAEQQISDISQLTERVIAELRVIHPLRVVRFEKEFAALAAVDEVRFRQMLSNLIGNALQHSPPGEEVSVRIEKLPIALRISVRNQGEPLSKDQMTNLFAPFQRGHSSNRRAGLGLGLYISSEIARAHHGSIHANSDATGTTFTVLVPRA